MNDLKEMVKKLLNTKDNQVLLLQQMSEELIRHYQLSVGGWMTIQPKAVEAYYVNHHMPNVYVDMNMHCMLDPKTNDEIWKLQSNRYGQLYAHRKGAGGVDICLSDSPDYALCFSIKGALVNGEEVWSGLKLRTMLLTAVGQHESLSDKDQEMAKVNSPTSYEVLMPHDNELPSDIYHIRRSGLRHKDKHTNAPLHTLTDLWNPKQDINRVQKVYLYMSAHPEADVLEVLRAHDFHYIPLEIKVRYKLDRKAKLFE
jgi:hypothetical protein